MKKKQTKWFYAAIGLCLLAIIGTVAYYFLTDFAPEGETAYLYIDQDDTADSVYQKLTPLATKHGMTALRTMARHTDYEEHVRTGRYAISPGENAVSIYRRLKNGQQSPIMLTIPEARTMPRLAALLSRKLMVDSAEIANALTDPIVCQQVGYDTATIACMFVPDTYEVFWNISVSNLLQRMQSEHDRFWNDERRAKASAIGLTPNEVSTLASIIDEETANNGEKNMIAGMYLNRLKTNMPLQADPTVKFALKNFALRRIYHNMLQTDSPYNTYKNTGLPPGPIKIASIKGIDAVLNRVEHDYLYMCAKEDFSGTHNFATTYKEHLQNAARYTKALNERNIK